MTKFFKKRNISRFFLENGLNYFRLITFMLYINMGGPAMENILSKQSKRFLSILEHLYYNESSSLKKLAELSDASVKTVREDINKINQFIEPLHINFSDQQEYQLSKKNNISSDFIYSRILSESLEYSVLEMIFFEKESTLEDYADSLFISLSTLKRIISKINKQIKKKGFEITSNPTQIIGNEEIIRRTMVHFFREKYVDKEDFFNKPKQKIFDELIFSLLEIKNQFFNVTDLEKISLIIYVSLIRLQNDHHHKIPNIKNIEAKLEFPIVENQLYAEVFQSLFDIELTKQHIIELGYPYTSDTFAYDINDLHIISSKVAEKKDELYQINKLIKDISQTIDIELTDSQKEAIVLDLFNLGFWTVANTHLIYDYKHNFLINLSKDFPLVYHFLYQKIDSYFPCKDYKKHIIEEIMYILITHWDNLFYAIQSNYPKFKVGVFMNSDTEHTHFLMQILKQQLDNRFSFEAIEYMDYSRSIESFSQYDIILINKSKLKQKHPRTISIDLYPSLNDFNNMYKMYFELCQNILATK